MMCAFVTAMATNTYSYLPAFKNELNMEYAYATALVVLGVCLMLVFIAWIIKKTWPDLAKKTTHREVSWYYLYVLLQELIFGTVFGLSMGVSNMTLLSAVIAFLDLRYWNPALGFVMGGAITVAFPSFYYLFNKTICSICISFFNFF